MKILIHNKKQNIKDWFAKPREERYKYYNPDKEQDNIALSNNDTVNAMFYFSDISSTANNKMYVKDVNRQMHYNKGRIKIIINTLNSIFNEPFEKFCIQNKTSKSTEALAVEINQSVKKMVLYFLLALSILFVAILAFNAFRNGVFYYESSNVTVAPPKPSNSSFLFYGIILAIVGIYVVITALLSIIFNIVTFICLWKFINNNTTIVYF